MSVSRKKQQITLSTKQARASWLHAQRLSTPDPFGTGPQAVAAAVAQLGYVQIDTINVIERCHHHILYNRIPSYTRADLTSAQSVEKTLFEYWTHALSFVPVEDFRFFVATMKQNRTNPTGWTPSVSPKDFTAILARVRKNGPLSISDIKDDKLVEKAHLWASKKPSKRALQAGFFSGQLVISKRQGMLKSYELTKRHFDWQSLPKPATPNQITAYLLNRALRAQSIISLDSICHLQPKDKPAIAALIEKQVRTKKLIPLSIAGSDVQYWAKPEDIDQPVPTPSLTHILSPFDPLIIQRKRTAAFFGYEHLFEAYVPKEKRKLGYFTLPVLVDGEIVAALDLKTDRQANELLIQSWHWMGQGNATEHKSRIEAALEKFEQFQFNRPPS